MEEIEDHDISGNEFKEINYVQKFPIDSFSNIKFLNSLANSCMDEVFSNLTVQQYLDEL